MKSFILCLITFLYFSRAFPAKQNTTNPPTPAQPSVIYDETPQLVREKTQLLPPPPQAQAQIQMLSPNVQAQSIILSPSAMPTPHLVHGFNLENIDPDLEIVRKAAPLPIKQKPNVGQAPANQEAKGDNSQELPKINIEANRKLNKTHNLIKSSYEKLKAKGGNLKNRKEIQGFMSKVKYFKQALNMHNEELSRTIFQNYRILETVTQEILKIREDLLESDINQGKTKQSKEHITYIQNIKRQVAKVRNLIKMLSELKNDQKMWDNPKVLSESFPRKIVKYFDLNNQVYQVNKWVHITEKNPWNSIQILKREAYYDPTRCATPVTFIHFKEYEKIVSEQSKTMNEISGLLDKALDSNSTRTNSNQMKESFTSKFKSIDNEVNTLITGLTTSHGKKTRHLKHIK